MMTLVLAVVVLLLIAGGLAYALASSRGVEAKPLVPPAAAPAETPEVLVGRGQKVAAIRRYREQTGASLADARRAVEAMVPGRPAMLPAKQTLLRDVHDSEIEAQIRRGAMLDAITLYREKTGVGLKEAKHAVEAWRDRLRAS